MTTTYRAISKTERVCEHVADLINSGSLPPGSRLIPEDQLAEQLGVSLITVRRGLKRLTEAGLIYRIQGSGTFVAEREEETASEPALLSITNVIYESLPRDSRRDVFLGPVLDGLGARFAEDGLRLLLQPLQKEQGLADSLQQDAEAALLKGGVVAVNYRLSAEESQTLSKLQIPHVQIGVPTLDSMPSVDVDHFQGGFQATLHLLRKGRRKIALITGHLDTQVYCHDIIRGYQTALESHDIVFDASLLASRSEGEVLEGEILTKQLLNAAPDLDAVICYGDDDSIESITTLKQMGRRVPEDVSFVSYNDFTLVANHQSPSITAIRQPVHDLGEEAAELILRARAGEDIACERIILKPELIVRDSA